VLDAAAGVERLHLRQHPGAAGWHDPIEPDQRRIADDVDDRRRHTVRARAASGIVIGYQRRFVGHACPLVRTPSPAERTGNRLQGTEMSAFLSPVTYNLAAPSPSGRG